MAEIKVPSNAEYEEYKRRTAAGRAILPLRLADYRVEVDIETSPTARLWVLEIGDYGEYNGTMAVFVDELKARLCMGALTEAGVKGLSVRSVPIDTLLYTANMVPDWARDRERSGTAQDRLSAPKR